MIEFLLVITLKKAIYLFVIIILLIAIIFLFSKYFLFSSKGNEEASIELYEKLIDLSIVKDDIKQYLAIKYNNFIDPLNKKELSIDSQKEIATYLEKYSKIYDKNKDELLTSKNYGDGENLYGLSLSINTKKVASNKAIVSLNYYKNKDLSYTYTYNITYINNMWEIQYISKS